MADWQRILDEHGATVWQTAYRLLGNTADTADCLQDTFVSAWEVSRRQRVRNWPGLLRRLATARALDGLRWRARQSRRRVDVVDWSQFTDAAADPTRDVECREMIARLRCALADLRLLSEPESRDLGPKRPCAPLRRLCRPRLCRRADQLYGHSLVAYRPPPGLEQRQRRPDAQDAEHSGLLRRSDSHLNSY